MHKFSCRVLGKLIYQAPKSALTSFIFTSQSAEIRISAFQVFEKKVHWVTLDDSASKDVTLLKRRDGQIFNKLNVINLQHSEIDTNNYAENPAW